MEDDRPTEQATSLDSTLGFEGYEFDGERRAKLRMPVSDAAKQPFGIVHGGSYAALAESLCSMATYAAVSPDKIALGQSNDTAFLRPVSVGAVHATATVRHRGRTSWVWEVEMSDDEGRLCALSRMIIAVRPREAVRPPSG